MPQIKLENKPGFGQNMNYFLFVYYSISLAFSFLKKFRCLKIYFIPTQRNRTNGPFGRILCTVNKGIASEPKFLGFDAYSLNLNEALK
jgi:hypothetical protein